MGEVCLKSILRKREGHLRLLVDYKRYYDGDHRYVCELLRSRGIDLRHIGKGICPRRYKGTIQSRTEGERENKTFP